MKRNSHTRVCTKALCLRLQLNCLQLARQSHRFCDLLLAQCSPVRIIRGRSRRAWGWYILPPFVSGWSLSYRVGTMCSHTTMEVGSYKKNTQTLTWSDGTTKNNKIPIQAKLEAGGPENIYTLPACTQSADNVFHTLYSVLSPAWSRVF